MQRDNDDHKACSVVKHVQSAESGDGLTHGAPDSPRYLTVANVHTLVYM